MAPVPTATSAPPPPIPNGLTNDSAATPFDIDTLDLTDRPSVRKTLVRCRPQAVVTKGGSWFDGPEDCRAAARRRRLENELDLNLGFRVVREL